MKHNYAIWLFVFALLAGGNVPSRAQTASALAREAQQAQQAHRREQALARVTFEWEKPVYLSDKTHRRRAGFKDVLLKTEYSRTHCPGVLVAGTHRVFTVASCAQAPDNFALKSVRVQLANGRQGMGGAGSVAVHGDFAGVVVSDQLTAGVHGVTLGTVPEGKSLYDTFGPKVQQQLLEFFMERGVISARASRLAGIKNTLQKGEPFFYRGQLVALVKEVPSRLPVSFWGGLSEDSLAVFRPGVLQTFLTDK